ncbi:MAG: biopolymer transporter ExbD [Chitinivibrionales bacterium]|nr:biopolymer transporter ExbD [Chitinivibrionales bacterium]
MFEDYGLVQANQESGEINMGPLIDMVFILLIFFVITTNFNRQTGVDVSKPKAQSAISQGQKTMMIGVTREGTIHVYGRQVSLERLETLVKQEIGKRPDMSVVIIADENAAIGKAVQVMDKCALAGAAKVSLAADKE